MANRSYLVVTDDDTIYPSTAEKDYNPDTQIVAQGVYCVPLLWLGLFRPADMRMQHFSVHGESITGVGPVVPIKTALAQLNRSVAMYDQMFPDGRFADYCDLLRKAVVSMGRKYVTVELEEIADMGDPVTFYNDIRIALRALNGDESLATGRDKLIKISEISSKIPIPPARCLLGGPPVSDDQVLAHSKIIGCSWVRPVPWEPGDDKSVESPSPTNKPEPAASRDVSPPSPATQQNESALVSRFSRWVLQYVLPGIAMLAVAFYGLHRHWQRTKAKKQQEQTAQRMSREGQGSGPKSSP